MSNESASIKSRSFDHFLVSGHQDCVVHESFPGTLDYVVSRNIIGCFIVIIYFSVSLRKTCLFGFVVKGHSNCVTVLGVNFNTSVFDKNMSR